MPSAIPHAETRVEALELGQRFARAFPPAARIPLDWGPTAGLVSRRAAWVLPGSGFEGTGTLEVVAAAAIHSSVHTTEPRVSGRSRKGSQLAFTRSQALRALGLCVTYHRGEGSRLWHGAPDERLVWDFLGGYGSTFFGHNHPTLSGVAEDFLRKRRVIHAQASVPAESDRLEALLEERLRRSTGDTYEIVLASTGAEAVEVGARHARAELARRRDQLAFSLEAVTDTDRSLPWSADASSLLRAHGITAGPGALRAIADHNRAQLERPAMYLAVEGGFHGMTHRALSLTEDPGNRFGRGGKSDSVRFVGSRDPQGIDAAARELGGAILRIRRGPQGLEMDAERWTPIAGFFMEPIQGEGGIHPVPAGVARAWMESCTRHEIPLVADEIQCGMGRTGTFLYSEQIGIRPDYVLLGKSLGGGIAKLSAAAIRADRFLPGFTLQHASTFAGDDFSSHLGCRALELLDQEHALDQAAEKGRTLLQSLRRLAERYPDVIEEIRGAGLMLGIEWRVRTFDRSNALDFFQEKGWIGYVMAGFLLGAHGVRVAPTLAGGDTIRVEPAYAVPEEAVQRLLAGLDELCRLLREQDAARILAPSMGFELRQAVAPRSPRRVRRAPLPTAHVGFIGHLIRPDDLALWDANFSRFGPGACDKFLENVRPLVEPVLVHRDHVESVTGARTSLSFVGLAVPSQCFHAALRDRDMRELRNLVQRAIDRAAEEGCSVVGLGGYCSIITRNGRDLDTDGMAVTTGNGYTVGAGIEAMRAVASELGIHWASARAAVVGATGNIGSVLATMLAGEVSRVVLLGRESRLRELETLAGQILWSLARTPHAPIVKALDGWRGVPDGGLENGALARLFRAALEALGPDCPVRVGSNPALCRDASLIVTASNEVRPLLYPEHVSKGPVVINDLSVPPDVHPSVSRERPAARVICGGVVRTPANPDWYVPGIPLAPGEMYACMTETALMGLDGERRHGSYGALTPERVRATLEMAARHGFSSVRTNAERSYG